MNQSTLVNNNDLYLLLFSSVSYAIGRRSYIVSSTIEMIEKYQNALRMCELETIKNRVQSDIEQAELADGLLGDPVDHWAWKNFILKLQQLIERRQEDGQS